MLNLYNLDTKTKDINIPPTSTKVEIRGGGNYPLILIPVLESSYN